MRTIKCASCGAEVETTGYHQLYCRDCSEKINLERRKEYKETHRKPRHTSNQVDGEDRINACLTCKRPRCTGDCEKMRCLE